MDMHTFLKYHKEASSLKKPSIEESQLHNKETEKIEQMKPNTSKWESKMKELAYKKQLIAEYEKLEKGYEQEGDVEVLPRNGRIHDRQQS